jgi:hypothetical protein
MTSSVKTRVPGFYIGVLSVIVAIAKDSRA